MERISVLIRDDDLDRIVGSYTVEIADGETLCKIGLWRRMRWPDGTLYEEVLPDFNFAPVSFDVERELLDRKGS